MTVFSRLYVHEDASCIYVHDKIAYSSGAVVVRACMHLNFPEDGDGHHRNMLESNVTVKELF
jgi:hypothetical protein